MKENDSLFLSSYKGVSVHVNGSAGANRDCEKTLSITTDLHLISTLIFFGKTLSKNYLCHLELNNI